MNTTFESSFFQPYRQRQGEHSHRTQPSSVKQFQLLLLMNSFFAGGWGGKKVLACFLGVAAFIELSPDIDFFLLIQFKNGEGLKHQLF